MFGDWLAQSLERHARYVKTGFANRAAPERNYTIDGMVR